MVKKWLSESLGTWRTLSRGLQDFHWINSPDNITWRPHEGDLHLPEEGWVNFPVKQVVEARKMAGLYDLRGVPDGQVGCRA